MLESHLLGRDAEPNVSCLPANLDDLPVKTKTYVEGEDLAVWALKSGHMNAVVPMLKSFLCGISDLVQPTKAFGDSLDFYFSSVVLFYEFVPLWDST